MNYFQMWLLALIGVVVAVTEIKVPDCPLPVDISLCQCDPDYALNILCNHLESVDQIYELAEQLKSLEIRSLYFDNLNIPETIKSDAFMGISATELELSHSAINLEAPQFVGLEDSLKDISFSRCFDSMNSLITLDLGHLSKLECLLITENKIDNLPDGWLASAPDSLDTIILDYNGLKSLGEHAFSDITSLFFITLNDNKLTSLKRSMFPKPAMELVLLDMNDNQVSHLPSDIFTEMPALQFVSMMDNHLTTLDMATWSNILPQLLELNLTGNPLDCDSSMEWLPTSAAWDQGIVYGKCDSPQNLKGKQLDQLKAGDFV